MKWLQMNQWIRGGMILLFALSITVPPALTAIMPRRDISKMEYRKLADWPKFESRDIHGYLRGVDRYFRDHIGLRQFLTILYNQGMIEWFRKSPIDFIVLGKKGWLFTNSEKMAEDSQGKIRLDAEVLQEWARMLQERKDWLARRGVKYLFVLAPDKQSIYPEYLPERFQKRLASARRIDQVIGYLKAHTDVPVLDLRPALLAAKAGGKRLYYKSDTHWNWQAGWIAYQQIMHLVRGWFPDIEVLDSHRVHEVEKPFDRGDLAMRLGMGDRFAEQEEALWISDSCVVSEKPIYNDLSWWKFCPAGSRRVIVARDSYFIFIEPFLSETFRDAIYIWKRYPVMHSYDHAFIKELIGEVKPDLVIEERVERFLDGGPGIILEEQFDDASKASVVDTSTGFHGVMAYHDIELVPQAGGLGLNATGGDPGILVGMDGPDTGSAIVRIEIESAVDTKLQIFFKSDEISGYSEKDSLWYPLNKGLNTLYVPVEKAPMLRYLRIDPGTAKAMYVLRRIEARVVRPLPDIGDADGELHATP